MSDTASPVPVAPRAVPAAELLRPPTWVAVLIGWALFVGFAWSDWTHFGRVFNDTDDAMRLVEIRDFLAGQGWRDLLQHRLDPAAPVAMHWSRLVDAPVAVLILLFRAMLPDGRAEALAMAVWPLLVAFPAFVGLALVARRIGGRNAVLATMLLVPLALSATRQFIPGRIDHHNVQIALTLLALGCAMRPRAPRAAALAGIATSLLLMVGIEAILFAALPAAALGLRYALQTRHRDTLQAEMAAYGLTLGLLSTAGLMLLAPPAHWLTGACDALSATYAAGTLAGGLGLVALSRWRAAEDRVALRWLGLAAVAMLAAAAFLLPEPACWRGPSGQIDPALRPIWLDHINEMQPITNMVRMSPAAFAVLAGLVLSGLAAAAWLLRRPGPRRSAMLMAAAALLVATLATGTTVRLMAYASMFALPWVGAAIARAATTLSRRGTSPVLATVAGLLIANSMTTAVIASAILPEGTIDKSSAAGKDLASREPCQTVDNYAPLDRRPPGLVLGFVDAGPFVLAATHHSTLSAPYHRQAHGMKLADTLLRAAPATAAQDMAAAGVRYVALCTESPSHILYRRIAPEGVASRLLAGESVPGLDPIPGVTGVALYEVMRPRP